MLTIMGGLVVIQLLMQSGGMVIQLLMQSGAAQRMKGLGRPVIIGRAPNINDKNYTVVPGNATEQLLDLVLYPSNVQCPHL